MTSFRALGVIPARLGSTRLPRKVLRQLAGKPMLQWVYQAARACPQLSSVVVAADSEEVAAICRSLDIPVELTSPALPSGSDRVHAIAQLPAFRHFELYVNIQADEPLLQPEHITALLRPFAAPHVDVATLKVQCAPEDLVNPHTVKVVTALDGRALYFSRATIPYDRDGVGPPVYKHLGFYAYRAASLARFHALPPSPLERTERLEQLRLLENNLALYVEPVEHDTIGVDTEADLVRVERLLKDRFLTSDRLKPKPQPGL